MERLQQICSNEPELQQSHCSVGRPAGTVARLAPLGKLTKLTELTIWGRFPVVTRNSAPHSPWPRSTYKVRSPDSNFAG